MMIVEKCVGSEILLEKLYIWHRFSIFLLEVSFCISKLKSATTMTSLIDVSKAWPIEVSIDNIEAGGEVGGL